MSSGQHVSGVKPDSYGFDAGEKEIGGSVCESNAPLTSKMPIAGFEDRESHRTPFASAAGRNRWPQLILKPRLGLGKLSL